MRQLLLDIVSAAEIIGVDNSIVLGWCKNNIINCQPAPDEYTNRTKFLIEETECNYISGLIKKYGTRMALLNYNKNWRKKDEKEDEKKLMVDSFPWVLDLDVAEDPHVIPQEQPNLRISNNLIKNPNDSKSELIQKNEISDELVASIIHAHFLKEKIAETRIILSNLEKEYNDIKNVIVGQI